LEIARDPANAVVRATPVNKPVPPVAAPVEKPAIVAPKPDLATPPKIAVPLTPILPTVPPDKP
jgi:hypothetical protein